MHYHDWCQEACLMCSAKSWCKKHQDLWLQNKRKSEEKPPYVECPCGISRDDCWIHKP